MKYILVLLTVWQFFFCLDLNAQRGDEWRNRDDFTFFTGNLREGNFQADLRDYDRFIEENPNDPIGYIHRARLYAALGRMEESKLDLKVAALLNPISQMYVDPSMRSEYSAKKAYAYDYEDLNGAFVKSPSRYKEYKKVLDDLSIEHSQDSLIVEVIRELKIKNIDKAEKLINKIEITELNRALVNDLLGKIHLKREDYSTAIQFFSKAIEYDPLFSIAYHNRSLCYKLTGDLVKAENDLKTAIGLNDDVSLFYFTYAKLNERKGDNEEALNLYSRAIDIDADYEEALVNSSQLLKGLGEYEAGLVQLNEAISRNPEAIENNFLKANLHFVYGDYSSAIDEYNTFLEVYPEDADARFNLGLSMMLLRKYEKGCMELSSSLMIEQSEKRRDLYLMFCNDFEK